MFLNFVLLLTLTAAALARVSALGSAAFVTIAITVTVSLVVLSALLEQRRWALPLEGARVLGLLVLGRVYGQSLLALLLGNS